MPKCPNDHDSTWEDFCSVCGEAISTTAGGPGAEASASAAAATKEEANLKKGKSSKDATGDKNTAEKLGLSCPNCSVSRTELDVFCESCGYDFASGTLPTEEPQGSVLDPGSTSGSAPSAANVATGAAVATGVGVAASSAAGVGTTPDAPAGTVPAPDPNLAEAPVASVAGAPATAPPDTVAVISLDREFFDRVAGGGELQFPDPEPIDARVTLVGNEILIGRRSDSRGIYPEIDLSPPMDDPAVSHRHAMLRQAPDGSWTVTDLDSTNGTYLGDHTVAMVAGKEKPMPLGTALFVGAYTKVVLEGL